MASSLDDDEILNDDYYSLLNVRREVQFDFLTPTGICASDDRSWSALFLQLLFHGYLQNHMGRSLGS